MLSYETEVEILSGVDASGRVAAETYATWRDYSTYPTEPPRYGGTADAFKWGTGEAGIGATISYWFDTASNWSGDERDAFLDTLALWTAVANVTIVASPDEASAGFRIVRTAGTRTADWNNANFTHPRVGSDALGVLTPNFDNRIHIDSNGPDDGGFGPIGTDLQVGGGFPLSTLIHEYGHMLGLGHGGPYDAVRNPATGKNVDETKQQVSPYDTKLWTIMSYLAPDTPAAQSHLYPVTGTNWGKNAAGDDNAPLTPMMLDILAIQRLYGTPTSGPLTGDNHIFGFGSNIAGSISRFYDFSINKNPVITIWATGDHNTLDASQFRQDAFIDLHPGTFSSVNGQKNNIGIAFFTVIDKAIGGSGNDTIVASDVGSRLEGRDGLDTLWGGAGNDTLIGGAAPDIFHPGGGLNVLRDTLADMDGDIIFEFGQSTTIDVTGVLIGRDNLKIVHFGDATTLELGDTEMLLPGTFADGDFMAVARGSGADAHTAVTFAPFLPNLFEGVRVNAAAINGVVNQPFLTGDGSVHFTLDLQAAVSTFNNTLGFYKVAADGTIGPVSVLFANSHQPGTIAFDLGTPGNGEKIGFFLIQDGADYFATLPGNLRFLAQDGAAANINVGGPPVLNSPTLGTLGGVTVFHSFQQLNPGNALQVLSGVAQGGKDLVIGFEDLSTATGDNDFQDVVIRIHTNHNDLFIA
jgi:hypothetical protein